MKRRDAWRGWNFSRPVELKSTDEFGMLSQNLNTMADNLENALSRLEAVNSRLETEVEREKKKGGGAERTGR